MFKRVLGIDKISRAQFNEDSDASDSDSDGDELTDKQRRRLQRAMMPLSAIVEGDTSCSSSSDEEEEELDQEDEIGDDDEEEENEEKSAPKTNTYAEQFCCQLCPEKLLLSQGDLEKHKASKAHLKRLHRQQQQGDECDAKGAGQDEQADEAAPSDDVVTAAAYKALTDEGAPSSDVTTSSRKMKRRLKMKERRAANKKRALNEDEIAAKKAKFQAKKDRRRQHKEDKTDVAQ
ncbi:FK506-binding protein, putative [Perkinsus marinus ATCC 50983]|uniref:FK506-binding protein, putative n=1 Tax=Perkinsus marinus (strain ATCC 50983 / TXsc) TaxID=423536 RepID=C5KYG5_PERM5|nr:FK506-binding protein, putative [Perkinsus marinus ATCC 50983]EER10542.1 FK506-binding protein, putative [Perkinsus marinus ATCC 50983]|eukprot:XP_002778747.1 FK506-binding protein, putative [Perkinsus marinus ATCC 50983]